MGSTRLPLLPMPADFKLLRPHQLGWLRRPELDLLGQEIWEKPDGTLHSHSPARGPLVIRFLPRKGS